MPNSSLLGDNERKKVFYPIRNSESFNYKTKLVGELPDGDDVELEDIKIVVPLKNLSNFMFNLDFLMINSEIGLILKWSEDCVLTKRAMREGKEATQNPAQDAVTEIDTPSGLKFNITDSKLYVPVVTLQTQYQNQLYKDLEAGISIDFK